MLGTTDEPGHGVKVIWSHLPMFCEIRLIPITVELTSDGVHPIHGRDCGVLVPHSRRSLCPTVVTLMPIGHQDLTRIT